MEQTLILLKPDALERNLVGQIISRFEKKGLKIVGLKMLWADEKLLSRHYFEHSEKPFYKNLKKFIKSGPIIALVLEGVEVISVCRLMVGSTNSRQALPGTIRGDFSASKSYNVIHASDGSKSAKREIKMFFKNSEIFNWKKKDFELVYSREELK